jgi:hypothetical protein
MIYVAKIQSSLMISNKIIVKVPHQAAVINFRALISQISFIFRTNQLIFPFVIHIDSSIHSYKNVINARSNNIVPNKEYQSFLFNIDLSRRY